MSQCSRVLEVLRDNAPHSIQEIHRRAGTMRLNSRISDLRRMGFDIAYYRKDGLHTYQLLPDVGTVREGEISGTADGAPSHGPSQPLAVPSPYSGPAGPVTALPPEPQVPAQQLTVWEAA